MPYIIFLQFSTTNCNVQPSGNSGFLGSCTATKITDHKVIETHVFHVVNTMSARLKNEKNLRPDFLKLMCKDEDKSGLLL